MKLETIITLAAEGRVIARGLKHRYGLRDVDLIYALIRVLRPSCVVETGLGEGLSSRLVIEALERNRHGKLVSIDPCEGLLKCNEFGRLVPQYLYHRWTLVKKRSQQALLDLLHQLGEIDLFIHDSNHSYQNMYWELSTALPYTRMCLIADDIGENNAYDDFARAHGLARVRLTMGLGVLITRKVYYAT